MFLKILFRNFRDCFVVQLSKSVTARLKQLVYSIKPDEVCQQLFSFIFKFLSDLMESVLFRVVLADSLIMIPLLFELSTVFLIFLIKYFIAAYKAHSGTLIVQCMILYRNVKIQYEYHPIILVMYHLPVRILKVLVF